MIEREVTDLVSISSSIFCLSLIIFSSNSNIEDNTLLIAGLTGISIINFLHIVFVGLELTSKNISLVFSGVSFTALILAIIGKLSYDNADWSGFWTKLNIDYNYMFLIGFSILTIFGIISFIAKPIEIENSSP